MYFLNITPTCTWTVTLWDCSKVEAYVTSKRLLREGGGLEVAVSIYDIFAKNFTNIIIANQSYF